MKKILLLVFMLLLVSGCGREEKLDSREEKLDTTANIYLDDGTVETTSYEDLFDMYGNNSTKYWKLYANKKITFIGTIESMHTYSSVNGSSYGVDQIKFKEGWILNLLQDSHNILEFDIGDKLSIESYLGSCMGGCTISYIGATTIDGKFVMADYTKLNIVQ